MKFKRVVGSNLLRHKVTLPDDLQGEFNLLFMAFQQWQQALVDGWMPFARQLEVDVPGLYYYEIPVIYKMNFLARTFLNEGMRAGIPDPVARQKTITLYLDKPDFRQELDISHEETIQVLLLDRQGNILWREEGAFSAEKGQSLRRTLHELSQAPADRG